MIVGLGPVGATAARLLARHGVQVLALEREQQVAPVSRAVTIDDRALLVLEAAGLGPGSGRPPMLTDQPVRFRAATGRVLLELPPRTTALGQPALAFLHQPDLDRALRDGIDRLPGVGIELGQVVESLSQDEAAVALSVRDVRTRQHRTLRASFVLGCDGSRSAVRSGLGIRLRGRTARRRWLAVDAEHGGSRAGHTGFDFWCGPARPAVNGPLPGGAHRFEFMLRPGERASPETVRALLEPFGAPPVLRYAAYAQHARVADRWRSGRAFLLGDAAHLTPTFAGQGLSSGLQDADSLARRLAAVVTDAGPTALLDSYEAERRPHAIRTAALGAALGAAVEARGAAAVVRDELLRLAGRSPGVVEWAARGGWRPLSRG